MNDLMETEKEAVETSLNMPMAWEFSEKIIRTLKINGEPWWVAKDICEYFGDSDHKRSVLRLDDDEKQLMQVIDSMGRPQNATYINESGVYHLLFNFEPEMSRKDGGAPNDPHIRNRIEQVKAFRKWITKVVLPQIRKTGFYISGSEYQNLSKKLAELKKQVQLINQSPATINNEQALLEPLIKLFSETRTIYDGIESSILGLIKVVFDYLENPEKFNSNKRINEHTHLRLEYSAFLEEQGIRIAKDRQYKDTFMIWLNTDNFFISSAFRSTHLQGKWERFILDIKPAQCLKSMRFCGNPHYAIGIPIELFMRHANIYLDTITITDQ